MRDGGGGLRCRRHTGGGRKPSDGPAGALRRERPGVLRATVGGGGQFIGGIDLTFGLVAAITTLTGADPFAKATWVVFAGLLIKTVVQTVVAYFMRLRVTPTMKTDDGRVQLLPLPAPPP